MRIACILTAFSLLAGCASNDLHDARAVAKAPWLEPSSTAGQLIVITVRNQRAVGVRAGSTARDYDTMQTYGPSPRARADARDLAAQYGLRSVDAWAIEVLSVHCIVYAAPASANVDELLTRLRQDRRVESAQPLNSFATLAATYTDPYFDLQNNLQTLQVPQAQGVSRGEGIRIAIVDTGIDAHHPDLAGRVELQRNFVGGPSDSVLPERHGTAVAGVIAAVDNNRLGIVGIAPAVQLLSLRACWPAATNDARSFCNTFTLAQALSAAIDLRADIVNLSLGGPADPLLDRLVAAGMRRGIVYVGAMPPGASNSAALSFPANISGVIKVNSVELSHTDSGVATRSLFAPGANILTLTPSGGYDFMSGSSLAAASVSGGVALLLGHQHHAHSEAIISALAQSERNSADKPAGVPDAVASVDFCAAISVLDKRVNCTRQ